MQNNSWNNFWQSFKNWVKYGVWKTDHQMWIVVKIDRLNELIELQESQLDVMVSKYEAMADKRLSKARQLKKEIYAGHHHLSKLEEQKSTMYTKLQES